MKIGWAHDSLTVQGGAELTNATMVEAAPPGIKVVPCVPDNVQDADAYILNNIKFFARGELEHMTAVPYVKYEHDYWNCDHQPWQQGWIKPVMEGARAVVFMSPLHREAFTELHEVDLQTIHLVPSPVDPSRFAPAEQKAGTIWLGQFYSHKGVRDACRWAMQHQEEVTFYGRGPFLPAGPYVRLGGHVSYQDVPEIMGKAARFLFLPKWKEAFGRTVAEAVLSGCELVCNENVGALSWGWEGRREWAENLARAPADFWRIITEVLQ